jgi:hypothetical protein
MPAPHPPEFRRMAVELARAAEGLYLEKKRTARVNPHTKQIDVKIEGVILRAVAVLPHGSAHLGARQRRHLQSAASHTAYEGVRC